jgi:hypothetical protein
VDLRRREPTSRSTKIHETSLGRAGEMLPPARTPARGA